MGPIASEHGFELGTGTKMSEDRFAQAGDDPFLPYVLVFVIKSRIHVLQKTMANPSSVGGRNVRYGYQ